MRSIETNLYFLEGGDRIKIGITKNLTERVAELQRQNGKELRLLCAIKGSWHLEQHIHRVLADHRLHGEWFKNCKEVHDVIDALKTKGPEAIGFVGPRKPKKKVRPFVPSPPQPFHILLGNLIDLMWPHEGLARLSDFSEYPEDVCRQWLSGEAEMPRLIRMAFASEIITWMFEEDKRRRASAACA